MKPGLEILARFAGREPNSLQGEDRFRAWDRGAKRFRRALVGICRSEGTITEAEAFERLVRVGLARDYKQARNIMQTLVKERKLEYSNGYLFVARERSEHGDTAYFIKNIRYMFESLDPLILLLR